MNLRKIAIAAVCACAVALVLTFGLDKKNQVAHDAFVRSQHLFRYEAASKAIAPGQRISADMLMTVNWTSDQPVIGAYSEADKATVVGHIALYPIADGMVITDKLLAGAGSSLGLPEKIPDGMRAMAVRTDEVTDMGGLLFPGTHVDVMATLHPFGSNGARTVTVVQNVEVLATGKQMTPDPAGKPISVSVVTILISPTDAQKVALAQQQGSLHIVLRNGGDQVILPDRASELSALTGGVVDPIAPRPSGATRPHVSHTLHHSQGIAIEPFPQKPSTTVQTVMGDKSYSQTFRGNLPTDQNRPEEHRP